MMSTTPFGSAKADTGGSGGGPADNSNRRSVVVPLHPAPKPSAMLNTSTGDTIPIAVWNGDSETKAIVVAVHAFGDYRLGFAELAKALNAAGHTLIAYDQAGFGATVNRGAYASDETYRAHLQVVVEYARRRRGAGQPVVVLGESFGGSVALSAIARKLVNADGLILSGPGVREDLPVKPFWDGLISAVASLFGSSSVRLAPSSEGMSRMARHRFETDPLIVRDIRADTYEQVVALADIASVEASDVTIPSLVMYGLDDALIARQSIDALMKRLGQSAELRLYQNRSHLVLQAAERADVERDILRFLQRIENQASVRASGAR